MVVKRSPLRSLIELQAVAQEHLVVQPTEDIWLLLRALGVFPKSLSLADCRRKLQNEVLRLTTESFVGCVRFGPDLYDAYQIGERDLLCLSLESFGLNEILILARYQAL